MMVAQKIALESIPHSEPVVQEATNVLTSPKLLNIDGMVRQTKEIQSFGRMLKRYPDLEAALDGEIQSYVASIRRHQKAVTFVVSSVTFLAGLLIAGLIMLILHLR